MLKNILGALVFTVAVFFVVDFIGNVMVNPATAPHQSNLKVADAEPAPAPEPPQEAASSTPTSMPEAASPEAVTSEAVTPEATAPVVAPATAMAGDVDTGSKTFRKKCMGCHTADKGGANRTGPNLWGIVGKAKGASEGYRYSKNMSALGGTWSAEDISAFIAGPRTFLPDTKMTFPGLKSEQDRADVLAYLKTLKD